MSTFRFPHKDPSAVLDYTMDWGPWLGSGETITGTPVITVGSGITKDSQTNTSSTVTTWLSGGTAGEDYTIEVRVTTTDGRTDERSFIVPVRDR